MLFLLSVQTPARSPSSNVLLPPPPYPHHAVPVETAAGHPLLPPDDLDLDDFDWEKIL